MKKVYGPYTRKDGRKHVIHYDDGIRRTQSYPRYLMETFLGRKLLKSEEVDHINDDPTDDRLENFQILTQSENIQKSVIPAETMNFICPVCNREFTILARHYRHNQLVRNCKGPYCSKHCSGIVNH